LNKPGTENEALKNLVAVCLVIFAGVLVYSNSFSLGWHFDDEPNIINNPAIRDIFNLKAIWHYDPARFVTAWLIALNYHWGHVIVFGYHIVNMVIHLTAAVFVWWFVRLLFSTPQLKHIEDEKVKFLLPFFAAMIFTVHPVQTQAVTYIIQRATSLAALFYTASIAFYIKYRLERNSGVKKYVFYAAAFMACLLGMFSKETVFTLPLMLCAIEFFFFKDSIKKTALPLVPFLLTLAIIPIVVLFAHPSAMKETNEASGAISSFTYLMTQFRVIVTYIRLFVFPAWLNLDYDFPISKSFFELRTIISFIFLLCIAASSVLLYKKHRLASFGIFWFFLTLAVESSVWPIKDVIYEHRMYLPLLGCLLVYLALTYNLFARFKMVNVYVILNSVIILIFAIAAYQRNFVWDNELSLWSDVIQKSPAKYRPYVNRGLARLRRFDLDNAMIDFRKALTLDSTNAIAYCNIGVIYGMEEVRDSAMMFFNKALQYDRYYEEALNNRGNLFYLKKQYDRAMNDFNIATLIKPYSPNAFNNRGTLYFIQGNYKRALMDFGTALKNDPASKEILKNIGLTYDKLGDHYTAISFYNKALALDSGYPDALFNRAIDYYILRKFDLSERDLNVMRKLKYNPDPDFKERIKSIKDENK